MVGNPRELRLRIRSTITSSLRKVRRANLGRVLTRVGTPLRARCKLVKGII